MKQAAAIQSYLRAGRSTCPFAKACPLELVTVSAVNPRADRVGIFQSASSFAAARGNAIVLLSKANKGFTATATWAAETFLELMICCAQISQPDALIVEIEHHVERYVRPALNSHEIRPYVALHGKSLMTICMAPVYPASHPRYAPHTILVSTWSDDVAAAQGTAAVTKIRAAMVKEHGHVYDANELMLPLPTRRPPLDPTRKVSEGGHPEYRLALGIDCPVPSCRAPKGQWCPMPGAAWNLCDRRVDIARGCATCDNEVKS